MDAEPRVAGVDDLDGFVDTLTLAFADDPIMSWSWPDREARLRRLPVLWRTVAGGLNLPAGACTTLPAHDAVAMWQPPGFDAGDFWARHGTAFVAELEGDLGRFAELGPAMAAARPDDPHWYLPAIGVRPEAQGRGLGGVLLAHTLAVADERAEPAYLEATSPRSRALYERFGFVARADLAPPGCPPLWAMWREPLTG